MYIFIADLRAKLFSSDESRQLASRREYQKSTKMKYSLSAKAKTEYLSFGDEPVFLKS